MYKSRLYSGNTLFLVGALPVFLLLNSLSPTDGAAQAGAVGVALLFVLGPLMLIGGILALSALIKLANLERIQNSQLNTPFGILAMTFGWVIGLLSCAVIAGVIWMYLTK